MRTLFVVLSILIFVVGYCQKKHTVQSKETIYGISKMYNITQEELVKANPSILQNGINPGDVLIIPKPGTISTTGVELPKKEKPKDEPGFTFVEIQPKETLYQASKKYGLSIEKLIELNPQYENGLIAGEYLKIPAKKTTSPENPRHFVEPKETLYGIAKRYGVSIEQIIELNPYLKQEELKEGTYLILPKNAKDTGVKDVANQSSNQLSNSQSNSNLSNPVRSSSVATNSSPLSSKNFFEHRVQKGETVFSVMKQYDVTLDELMQANPRLSDDFKPGAIIKVPLKVQSSSSKISSKIPYKREVDEVIDILMILPFNTSDNTKTAEREVAKNFYAGAKIAIDSLVKTGKAVNLNIYDSGTDSEFDAFISNYNFSKIDIIIGPLFKNQVLKLANFLKDTRIPIVSPLSNSNDFIPYRNIISAEPMPMYMADKIISEILDIYKAQKVVILYDDDNEELANYINNKIKEKKPNAQIIRTTSADQIVSNQDLTTEQNEEVIAVLLSTKNSLAADFLSKVKEIFDKDANLIRPFSMYFNPLFEEKVYTPVLKATRFMYTCERKVNIYGKNEKNVLKKFRESFCETPDKYAIIGFDVTFDLVSRMNALGELFDNLKTIGIHLGSKFDYIRIDLKGAYYNRGFRFVKFTDI